MVVHIHDGNSPTGGTAGAPLPVPVPVFVDATGRRARLMRRCGALLAAAALVYVPIVGLAVLTGPSVPRSAPLLDDETGMEIGEQPPERVGPLVPAVMATDEVPDTDPVPTPEPARDRPARALPPPVSEPSHPSPSAATRTPSSPTPSPSPSGTVPSPSPQAPPPVATPTAPALLDAAGRYLAS